MYKTSLFIDVRVTSDKKRILDILFKDWADHICNNQISYSIISTLNNNHCGNYAEIIQIDFINEEDAVIMKLCGIPEEFRKYMEIVD